MPEWTVPLIGFAGVILGVGITEFRLWKESREKYHAMIFEKRLEVHQKAFYWCLKIGETLNEVEKDEYDTMKAFSNCAYEAREWLDNNCLYLNVTSYVGMIGALRMALAPVSKLLKEEEADIDASKKEAQTKLTETLRSIVEGIGVKYLPEMDEQYKWKFESRK